MCDEICVFNAEASSPDAVVCTLGSILAESTPCQKALDVLEGQDDIVLAGNDVTTANPGSSGTGSCGKDSVTGIDFGSGYHNHGKAKLFGSRLRGCN